MQPLIPRRRSRRRPLSGRVVLIACALIVTALAVGGLTQVGPNSKRFDSDINRSFAALGAVVAKDSNATASEVRTLMASMQTQQRPGVQATLDAIVEQARAQAAAALSAGSPTPPAGVGPSFAQVFADRAAAAVQLRRAFDGLLGMQPLPVAGSSTSSSTASASSPALLSADAAANRLTAVGTLLVRSDQQYATVRRRLSAAPGHATLPRSAWVTDAAGWSFATVAGEVDAVTLSPTLAASHELVLRTVRVAPEPLPPPSGAAAPGVVLMAPTRSVTVSVVLADMGTVDEPQATVRITLTEVPSGTPAVQSRTDALRSGQSAALDPATFDVTAGHSYQLTVAVVLPPAQIDLTQTSQTTVLAIAPSG